MASPETLQNYVGGKWTSSQAKDFVSVHNPALGTVIAKAPLSTRADLDAAVQAAAKAFPAWRDTPVVVRARAMFKLVNLLEQNFEELARTVTTEHHALLGSKFLTHPPIAEIRVRVHDTGSPLTRGLDASFVVEDEPYFIELQDPEATRILLTAQYGAAAVSPIVETLYDSDTSLQRDGKTRVIGYTRTTGKGSVTYFTLGHCHNPASRAGRAVDPTNPEAPVFRGAWETDAFTTLLRNAIAWGTNAA